MLISAPGLLSGIRLAEVAVFTGANCNISTTQAQFGASSLRNIGTSTTYANITPVTNFAFSSGTNFTIEFWYRATSTGQQGLLGFRPQSTNGNYISLVANYPSANVMTFYSNATRITTAANTIVANTWVNFALVRNTGNTRIYVNGTQSGGTYVDAVSYLASRFILASDDFTVGGTPLNGYIDELRISNIARYTGNYTVSNQPFIDDANTLILYHFDQANGAQNLVDDNS